MAAGRFDVSRKKRDFRNCSQKERHNHKNGYRELEFAKGHDHGCVEHSSARQTRGSDGESNGGGPGGQLVRAAYQELEELSLHESRLTDTFDGSWGVDNGTAKLEDGAPMPPEKRRKFSPVVWDRDDKGVRIESRNRMSLASTLHCSPTSSSVYVSQVANVVLDGKSERYPVTASQIQVLHNPPGKHPVANGFLGCGSSEFLGKLHASLLQEQCQTNGQEEEVEEGEYVEVQSISASKWANEMNLSDDEDFSAREGMRGRVVLEESLEIDLLSHKGEELQREGSEECRERSCGSDKAGCMFMIL